MLIPSPSFGLHASGGASRGARIPGGSGCRTGVACVSPSRWYTVCHVVPRPVSHPRVLLRPRGVLGLLGARGPCASALGGARRGAAVAGGRAASGGARGRGSGGGGAGRSARGRPRVPRRLGRDGRQHRLALTSGSARRPAERRAPRHHGPRGRDRPQRRHLPGAPHGRRALRLGPGAVERVPHGPAGAGARAAVGPAPDRHRTRPPPRAGAARVVQPVPRQPPDPARPAGGEPHHADAPRPRPALRQATSGSTPASPRRPSTRWRSSSTW